MFPRQDPHPEVATESMWKTIVHVIVVFMREARVISSVLHFLVIVRLPFMRGAD
jgi:hypothetical protein